ncbi:family 43 glycosylhydrolase [Gramella sp. AN32]|uniref:Family 43 glycosylhydrolase n=1 Tax=Christiangramia antarctica TaxID=2058158 RepID=A0ABW5XCP6_9FLAO|nr:family 43 glycosylhydrolase [Gramella sp. AN32]MCM4157276.1 beta-xylosidase [Gramella sp. AN32]
MQNSILYSCRRLGIIALISLLFSCSSSNTEKEYSNYLFSYFTGNGEGEEAVHYALSSDGYNYYALNKNRPILETSDISKAGGVRDPHILRGEDGKFYMVLTDLKSAEGWTNTAMLMLKSDDLINWESSLIDIPETYSDQFSDVNRVWAPQSFYDEEKGKYLVYFSMLQPGSYDKIYYAYANEDFTGLEEAPQQLFFNPKEKATIDGDIIKKDGKFHLFYKTEGDSDKGIKVAISDSLTGIYEPLSGNVDQTDKAVEGSGVFKLLNSDKYILMYDVYMDGEYQFAESTDLKNFKIVDEQISMNFHPRHGSVLPITKEETERLLNAFPSNNIPGISTVTGENIKSNNVVIDEEKGSIFIPVKAGTDLSNFEPDFQMIQAESMKPAGPQNFENGAVTYTLQSGDKSKSYKVSVSVNNNPVVEGYYADPEILYSNKTKKYYLYPTSDGFNDWSGTYFRTFSSEDLVNWKKEDTILDLKKDVSWADRNAWAPTIAEKKIDGSYKYFYYFTAAQKIGVAVSDNPTGPFKDSGKPLIDFKPAGVEGGQEIDPDVFTDPKSGKSYLYWGNSYLAVAELNPDMTSIKRESIKVMTPDETFREGAEVFYRDGKYYFLWSEDDTRSPNYRVRYATSDSPLGLLNIPEDNLVIKRDDEKQIYGTGHNSVLNIPGTDEWYIIYHRFTRPKGLEMGRAAGFHREVSIDNLEFKEDGNIVEVKPTLEGIKLE